MSSCCDAAPKLRFKSYRPGKTAIVLGYVRGLAPLLTICLHWHEGEVCVIVCACATIKTWYRHSRIHTRTCFLAHKVRAGTTCLVSVFTVLVRCVLGTCDSTLWYSHEHTHTHTDRWQIKGKTRILDPLHWGYYVVQLCCWHGLWDIENQYWFLLRYHLNLLITVLTTVISSRMTVPTFRRAQGLTG